MCGALQRGYDPARGVSPGSAAWRAVFLAALLISAALPTFPAGAFDTATAGETQPTGRAALPEAGEYHTPLAGEPYRATLLGHDVDIPARDRDNVLAFTAGGSFFTPQVGDEWGFPFAAFYVKHRWDDSRIRAIVSLFVNEADLAVNSGKFELLGHLDNDTVPFPMAEIVNGHEFKPSSIEWGTVSAWLGAGYRKPVPPYQSDNDFRLQLFAEGGYLYSKRTGDTGSTVQLPPDTPLYGFRLRARYDSFRRNIMELPHEGWAWGADLEYVRRVRWGDANYGGTEFLRKDTQDYAKVAGYAMVATGIPGLSERHRLLFSLYGGDAMYNALDRFSAFRIGGAPSPPKPTTSTGFPIPARCSTSSRSRITSFPPSNTVMNSASRSISTCAAPSPGSTGPSSPPTASTSPKTWGRSSRWG